MHLKSQVERRGSDTMSHSSLDVMIWPQKADEKSIALSMAYKVLKEVESMPLLPSYFTLKERKKLIWGYSIILRRTVYIKKKKTIKKTTWVFDKKGKRNKKVFKKNIIKRNA